MMVSIVILIIMIDHDDSDSDSDDDIYDNNKDDLDNYVINYMILP